LLGAIINELWLNILLFVYDLDMATAISTTRTNMLKIICVKRKFSKICWI